jgi:hypothetical protein
MRRGRLLFLFSNVALFGGSLQYVLNRVGTWSDGH